MRQKRAKCSVDGCDGLEELANGRRTGGLCATHRKRLRTGGAFGAPIRGRVRSALGLLEAAARSYDGSNRAKDRLRYAALVYVRKLPSK